ncbi:MAG: AarF/UbiB family protein [Crocinitomicaceae bacterium]|nr:AarF/UbiB family protein [Crocinitomicaceae bacterium]
MKSLDHIPQSKIQRASKILKIGAQVGTNYVKYIGNRILSDEENARAKLNTANANDIYEGLSELKGSALKMAQMMSLDDGILPKEFVEKFSLAQFSVPPLSAPLARKVFKNAIGKYPEDVFSVFENESSYAASIGQVHKAEIDNEKLAVKIQYPGVSESILSDLKLVKPFALRMMKLKSDEIDDYFQEVQNKLLEETDYKLEISNLIEAKNLTAPMHDVLIPKVLSKFSTSNVITMQWMEGVHLSEYYEQELSKEKRNKVGQNLWDFYLFHIHNYRKVHADPHPGNFKVNSKNQLIVLDFGCMKEIPLDFYTPFFKLAELENIENDSSFESLLKELEIITATDSKEDVITIKTVFKRMLTIINKPFQHEKFDFSSPAYFKELLFLGNKLKDDKMLKKISGKRGSKHFVYMNRTLIGLLGLMNALNGGEIIVNNYKTIAKV